VGNGRSSANDGGIGPGAGNYDRWREGMGHKLARLSGQASLVCQLDATSDQAHNGDVT